MRQEIRRVTVFGGDGFIGRYIVRRLTAMGATVIVYGRHARAASFLQPMGDPGQIVLADGDIAETTKVAAAISASDAVVNAVGILQESGRRRFMAIHRDAPLRIAELSAAAGVQRLVHISAIGADPRSASRYAASKGEGEKAVMGAFPRATILRPSIVFGIEDRLLNRFAEMARRLPVLPVIGGATLFQPVYVDDVAASVAAALNRPEAAGWLYELGGPEILSFREIIERLLAALGWRRAVIDLPVPMAQVMAAGLSFLPEPPITRDQIKMLQCNNVVGETASNLASLDVTATSLSQLLPRVTARFRSIGSTYRTE